MRSRIHLGYIPIHTPLNIYGRKTHMESIFISVLEASKVTGFPIRKWFQWIMRGLIPSIPELHAERIKGVSYASIAANIMIPVSSIPKHYREDFLKNVHMTNRLFSVDLIGFLEQNGSDAYLRLLDEISIIKQFVQIQQCSYSGKTEKLRTFATEKGYSLATLYRKENLFMQSDLKKLIAPTAHIYHPKDMCRLSEDFATFEWSKPNHLAKVQIQKKLETESKAQGTSVCKRCPYNTDFKNKERLSSRFPEFTFSCDKSGNGMLYPASKDPFNRFLSSLNDQSLKYAREGENAWRDEFMHVTKRDRPEKVNAVWFGDHHIGDVELLCGYDKNKKPILKRPWLTCNHDSASGALVGSVVSIRPNTMTIAESFCRAAAFTVDSPYFRLPEIYYVDRGRDYRSLILQGRDYDMMRRLEQHYYLNRAFCDNPLLPALNVTVRHALPRSGRSKTIERMFGTITRQFFQEIPGWVGNCPNNRPFDYEKELKELIKSGKIWTLEKFARYWFDVVVPAYNNTIPDGDTESPYQKYMRMEKADTLVPDWNTLSVFMAPKKPHKVHPQGIKYNDDLFWHPKLEQEDVMGHYVNIYDFDQTFCHSISVIHKGKYLCEAEPLIHQKVDETDRLKLEQHLEEQKSQKRRISRRVTAVKQVLKVAKVKAQRYINYEPVDDLPNEVITEADENPTMYCETIDTAKDQTEATILSKDANDIVKVAQQTKENIERILNGPKNNTFENYYSAKGKAIAGKGQNHE